MGTEIHRKSSFERYHSMQDFNEDSNSINWSLFYGDNKALTNGHFYNGFVPRTVANAYSGFEKNALKQKMLEHEAVFKNQVYELHRLYRKQRDIMEEIKTNEYHKHRISIATSSSSSLVPSQKPYEDCHKWQIPSFPLTESNSVRPSKIRKKLFDLELPPDDIIDHEEHEEIQYNRLIDLNEPIHVDPTHDPFERPTLNPYKNSTYLGNSCGKSNGGLTHKLTLFRKQPSFGDRWRTDGCYTQNGFYSGSSSGSKDPCTRLTSGGFGQRNCKDSNFIDLTETIIGVDLNNDRSAICKNNSKNGFLVNNEKIFGFPVFGNSCVSKNDSSSLVFTSASLRGHENEKIKKETEHKEFDMNMAYVEPYNLEKIKNHFDLNSCLTENDDFDEKAEKAIYDESLAKVAAEAIVAMTWISSQQNQATSTSDVAVRSDDNERLLLLVEVIENTRFVSNEFDEYEELTLQLELTKEEDYMPKPLAHGFLELDEAGRAQTAPARPRRGQVRRGRPRRDFQREVLPGLVSLSRHEVTKDLQIFGGLARRSGTRGRRKSVAVAVEPPPPAATPPPPPPLLEVVGLEERSLTGWGKITRRPRRQRCVAGGSVAVPLM